MSKCVGQGMLRGRPFGGTIIIIKKELLKVTQTVHCDERYVIIKVANYLFVNVYLPCVGTTNKLAFCDDIFTDICAWCEYYSNCRIFNAGDFSVNLDNSTDACCDCSKELLLKHSLSRCDDLLPVAKVATHVNASLHQESHIDFMS